MKSRTLHDKHKRLSNIKSPLNRQEWSASHPGHFTPKERTPGPLIRSVYRPHSRSGPGGKEKEDPASVRN